jgi:predicted DNA-binding transcriptional regulator AlpA
MPPDDITVATPVTWHRPELFLKTADVCALYGNISVETLWRWVKKGWFPKPVRIGPTSRNVWRASELAAVNGSAPSGPGWRPNAALAERRRRLDKRKADKKKKIKFVRQAP